MIAVPSSVVEIRVAQASDAEAIAELHAQSWRYAYRGALSDSYLAGDIDTDRLNLWMQRLETPVSNQRVLVAYKHDHLLAFACAYIDQSTEFGSLLDNIHVHPEHHGKGIGARLLAAISDEVKKQAPASDLYLWVLQNNLSAQQFYTRHGAINVGRDIWNAPGGTKVPRFRFAWKAGSLPSSR